ncbi:MAG TPA: hypothetical protein PKD72_14775 [Gemmatales bacterium]|nr:hypothetical protein [Gemmatales bacterium]
MNPVETMQLVVHHTPVPPRHFLPRIPIELERICLRCLEKQPGDRYASAAELAENLRRFLRGELPAIEPKVMRETPWQWFQRHALVTGLAILGMFLFLTGLMLLMVFIWQMHSRMLQLTEEKEEALRRLQQGQPLLLRQEVREKQSEAPDK